MVNFVDAFAHGDRTYLVRDPIPGEQTDLVHYPGKKIQILAKPMVLRVDPP